MTPAYIHLTLNHFPVIGVLTGILVMVYGTFIKSDEIKRVALLLFVLFALIAIPVYLTGEPAEEQTEHLAGVSHDFIEKHEDSALFSLVAILLLGAVSLATLILRNQKLYILCLILALIAGGLISWTARLGGQVRHSEIRSGAAPVSDEDDN